MLLVETRTAKAGMRLALPIKNPTSPEHTLLNAGFKLKDETLRRLSQMGVREIWIQYPSLDFMERLVNPRLMQQKREIARGLTTSLLNTQRDANVKMPIDSYTASISGLIDELLANPTAMVLLAGDEGGDDLMNHSVNVAFLSLMLGLKLDWYLIKARGRLAPAMAKQTTMLGLGAMLHDLGMLKLPPQIQRRRAENPDDRDPLWRDHVRLGFEQVRGQVDPTAAAVVMQHHQRWDGLGFPERSIDAEAPAPGAAPDAAPPAGTGGGMKGEAIHIFARIAAVADMYDRFRNPPGRPRTPAVAVIRRMLSPENACRFDPQVLRALLAVAPAYPPGTMLKLSDGRAAVAMDHSWQDPCRPTVQIIEDPSRVNPAALDSSLGRKGEVIDLRQQPDLHVAWAEEADVLALNFPPPTILQQLKDESGWGDQSRAASTPAPASSQAEIVAGR